MTRGRPATSAWSTAARAGVAVCALAAQGLAFAAGSTSTASRIGPSSGSTALPAAADAGAPPAASADTPDLAMRRWRSHHSAYFKRNWGVDIVAVKPVSSGYMLAFRYRVVDPEKAKAMNDHTAKAYLRDEASGSVFAVPAMENIGELRTGVEPEAGRIYFIIFGNPGRIVKPGSKVSVMIGKFHADSMTVE